MTDRPFKNNEFRIRIGNPKNPGLRPQYERLQQIPKNQNPYVSGTVLPGNSPVFYGREAILFDIAANLRQPKPACVSLTGERRIGKSSVLNQVIEILAQESGLITMHGDAQNWQINSPGEFFTTLHQSICQALDMTISNTVQEYADFRDFVEDQVIRHQYRFVLIIDEFDKMAQNENFDQQFFANLRALGGHPQFAFGYLISSRRPLEEVCRQHHSTLESSFWNIFGIAYVLGLLQTKEAKQLIEKPLKQSLGSLNPQALSRCLEWTGHHPAMIQMVMVHVWNTKQRNGKLNLHQIKQGLRPYFKDLWEHRNLNEQMLLLKMTGAQKIQRDALFTDLQMRGLINNKGQLFSMLFQELIEECVPEGKSVDQAIAEIIKISKGTRTLLDELLKWAKIGGKLWNALQGNDNTPEEEE